MYNVCRSWIFDLKNNPEKSSVTEVDEHIPWEYSMLTIWAFDSIKGEDYIKKFCVSLIEHAADLINFKKKKRLPLT